MNLEELKALYDFSGCTVLVTGGAGALGSEIACALVVMNANVVLPATENGKLVLHASKGSAKKALSLSLHLVDALQFGPAAIVSPYRRPLVGDNLLLSRV